MLFTGMGTFISNPFPFSIIIQVLFEAFSYIVSMISSILSHKAKNLLFCFNAFKSYLLEFFILFESFFISVSIIK